MRKPKTTNYTIRRYGDNQAIGTVDLTGEQFNVYESMCQTPQGLIRLGAMPHDLYGLYEEFQDISENTSVWLD